MSANRALSPEAIEFRKCIIDAFWDEQQFGYVTEDCFVGSCSICGHPIGAHFHGFAPRVTLNCHGGCTEAELAARLPGVRVR